MVFLNSFLLSAFVTLSGKGVAIGETECALPSAEPQSLTHCVSARNYSMLALSDLFSMIIPQPPTFDRYDRNYGTISIIIF